MQDHGIDVALVQETFLRASNKFSVPNYEVYRSDRVGRPGGGTMVLVKRTIDHYQPTQPELSRAEATSVIVVMKGKNQLKISSVYQPPGSRTEKLVPRDYQQLFGQARQKTILGGDFNSKNTLWGNKTTNENGRDLEIVYDQLQFNMITPDEPTFMGAENKDFLDMFLTRNVEMLHNIEVLHEMSSDHLPVILTVGNRFDEEEDLMTRQKMDWDRYRALLAETGPIPRIDSPLGLEEAARKLTRDVASAMSSASSVETKQLEEDRLPAGIKTLIREKNRLLKRARRSGDPALRRDANRATEEVRTALKEFFNLKWEGRLEELDPQDQSLWRMTRALTRGRRRAIPAVRHNNELATTPKEKASLMAEMLEDQFSPNLPRAPEEEREARIEQTLGIFNASPIAGRNTYFTTPQAVKEIIKRTSKRKAPGPDGITVVALKSLPQKQIVELTNVINAILRLSYFPSEWKLATVIMIHKIGAPSNEARSYRPISLLSGLGKVAEKVILEIMKDKVMKMRILPEEQYGFQPEHGTIHHTSRLAQQVVDSFNKGECLGAIMLDVSKAFDKVWHDGLVLKCIRLGLPANLTKLVQSFISDRRFRVRIEGELSEEKTARAGVPQGSPLSPLLFNIYTADIPKSADTNLGLFADDTAISTSSKRPEAITGKLQRHLDKLSAWFDQWRIQINPAKTQAILFSRSGRKSAGPVSLGGIRIPWRPKAKYLGLVYDKRLVWKDQASAAMAKAKALRSSLYPLLNRTSKLSLKNKIIIYKTIVRPGLLYGCQTWSHMCKTRRKAVQAFQNVTLRMITNAPWFVRNNQLHRDLQLETVLDFTRKSQERFLEKASVHSNPSIRNLFGRRQNAGGRYLGPVDPVPLDIAGNLPQ